MPKKVYADLDDSQPLMPDPEWSAGGGHLGGEVIAHLKDVVTQHAQQPLVDRIRGEMVALKAERERGGHSPARVRELIVWYDEAFGELQRAQAMADGGQRRLGD